MNKTPSNHNIVCVLTFFLDTGLLLFTITQGNAIIGEYEGRHNNRVKVPVNIFIDDKRPNKKKKILFIIKTYVFDTFFISLNMI